MLGIFEGICRHADVVFYRTREGADGGPCHGLGDFLYRFEIAGRGDGESRLDDIYPKVFKCLRHFDFLDSVELAPGHLFAVAEGGVENKKSFAHICRNLNC